MKNIFTIKIMPKINIPYSFIKYLALITMTYDHALKYIFNIPALDIILFPGRFAFPLFVFMITYNLYKKQSYFKYIARIAPFAIISFFVIHENYSKMPELNILFSFVLGVLIVWLLEHLSKKEDIKFVFFVAFLMFLCLFPISIFFEYGYFGICFFISFYYFLKTRSLFVGVISILCTITWMPTIEYALLMIVFGISLLFFNISLSKNYSPLKYSWLSFYIYYPLHFWIIALVRDCFGN